MDLGLKEKVAIVTGAAGGIGRVISSELTKEGAAVALVDNQVEALDEVVNEIKASGVKAIAVQADVCDFQQVGAMVESVRRDLGDIDILVNCAGGSRDRPATFLWEKPEDQWDAVINRNLKSVFNCCRAVIERMIEKRSGRIVSIASISGMIGTPKNVDYSAAKAGVIGFTVSLAKEVASYGITVNCVSPGPIIHRSFLAKMSPESVEILRADVGLPRLGKPEDIASMVVFLASSEAGYITGQNIAVGGLRNLGGPGMGIIR